MSRNIFIAFGCAFLCFCHAKKTDKSSLVLEKKIVSSENSYPYIKNIPLPEGFERVAADKGSFAEWLRNLPLKKNKTVYLYNGNPKGNQSAQFAVIDISVGKKDLQQCADAVMRMRAEYLYAQQRFGEIAFQDNNKTVYRLGPLTDRNHFDAYLENVFAHCGSASLEKQLTPLAQLFSLQPGDVLIKGGAPGHAMMVMDMARDKTGKTIYLLAQSYMPAQDVHVVLNPLGTKGSPWYTVQNESIITPEWVFPKAHFKKWP
jgi:hypothetical protein